MTDLHEQDRRIETVNNLLDLDIINVKLLAYNVNKTLHSIRCNVISFALEAGNGSNDFYNDVNNNVKLIFEPGYIYFLPITSRIGFCRTPKTFTITLNFRVELIPGLDIFTTLRRCLKVYDPNAITRMKKYLDDPDKLRASCGIRSEVLRFCYRYWPHKPDYYNSYSSALMIYDVVLRYIQQHCNANLTVAALAELKGQRLDVFSRNFKKAFGISPQVFIRNALIKKISAMLLGPSTIKEIARDLDFGSEFYLSRFFTKHVGMSPSKFKKLNKFEIR